MSWAAALEDVERALAGGDVAVARARLEDFAARCAQVPSGSAAMNAEELRRAQAVWRRAEAAARKARDGVGDTLEKLAASRRAATRYGGR